ncbi:SCP-like protein [Teladorsagia circumcincta]|uniref:SCP-like protein n=1 Tax=Teladorsagia circumcincta TaxID=45464 RepID=A0A2G9U5K0_TELCI|nr:SCP-like protein [Teladorsagia circumcincta]
MPRLLYQLLLANLCVGSQAHFIKPRPDGVVLGRWSSDFDDFGTGPYSGRDEIYTGRDVVTEDCGGRMTDDMRLTLLRIHNRERSRVAKGDYRIDAELSPLRKLPPATHMYQLKYNCSLERSALKYARIAQCAMIHSKWPGIGENLYASGSPRSFMYAANESASLWADELRKFGVEYDINEWTHDIGHATQVGLRLENYFGHPQRVD